MAIQATCHTCLYAHWDKGLWLRTMGLGWPARPSCGNQPGFPGRMRECPLGPACRNYRPRPPTPTGENVKIIPLTEGFYAYAEAQPKREALMAKAAQAKRRKGKGRKKRTPNRRTQVKKIAPAR